LELLKRDAVAPVPNLQIGNPEAERVIHGGHNIAEADLIRRFPHSLHNLLCFCAQGQSGALFYE